MRRLFDKLIAKVFLKGKEMLVLKEKEVIEVSGNVVENLSEGQKKRWKLLKGKKLVIGKTKRGKKLMCGVCGRESKKENSLFVIIKVGGKESLLSEGCCEKYFDRKIEEGGKRQGFKIYI